MPPPFRLRGLWVAGLLLLSTGSSGASEGLHAPWSRILATYVDADGRVAYASLAKDDRSALDAYLKGLAEASPEAWDRGDQIAYWINAYNAVIVAGVLDGYSPESFFGRKRFFGFYGRPVAGASRTPEDIEHGILRARFSEPRIHFALVCASTSCPKLRREAYLGRLLDEQLDDQAREFLGDPTRNRFDQGLIRISMIFKWFEDDFAKAAGSVAGFLGRYRVLGPDPEIGYLEYDWTLNAQPEQGP